MTPGVPEEQRSLPASEWMYDVFVVHAAAAEPFVLGFLLAKLALPSDRVLRLQALELGAIITAEIERGVRSSRVTLVVLSSACVDDDLVMFGQQLAAYASAARHARGTLLPLLLEDCPLTMHVESLVKLDFRDPSRDAWDAEIDRLRRYLERVEAPVPELRCPYPGMRPFTEADAEQFFGRDAELDRIVRRLRRGEREIYLIGASGSGKSSLLAAGLVPRLARGVEGLPRFCIQAFRPGERPLDRLVAALGGELTAPHDVVGARLVEHAPAASLLLVIDQLEELFAISSEGARREFLDALRELRKDPRCTLVLALRADFYGHLMESSLWTDLQGRISRIELGPLRYDSLRTIIERPARKFDVYVQPELVSRLIDDAAREPGALPLLQETLFQLWGKRRQRLLVLADYRVRSDDPGTRLAFAVKEHADDIYGGLDPTQKAIAFRILLRLVSFGDGRADTRRQQPRDALRSQGEIAADFAAVLQRLVNHRLLTVTGDDQHRDVRVDLSHEILIHAWGRFAGWIETWRAHEQRRRELEAAAAAWRARGGKDAGLFDPVELAAARAWQDRAASRLGHSTDLAALLAASEIACRRAVRQRWRARLILWIALAASVLTIVALRYASWAVEQRDQHNRLVAESALLYQDVGWGWDFKSRRPSRALPFFIAAGDAMKASGGLPSQSLRMLFAGATQNLPLLSPHIHRDRVLGAVFRGDSSIAITSESNEVWIRDAVTGASLVRLRWGQGALNATFNFDGSLVATSRQDSAVRVWDTATGELRAELPDDRGTRSVAFSPTGGWVVTTSWDRAARVWDAMTGKRMSSPLRHEAVVRSAAVSSDGTRVVTLGDDDKVRVWDAVAGKEIRVLAHHGGVVEAAFSPDGTVIATAGVDRTARIWNAMTGELLAWLQHEGIVRSVAFSRDSHQLVTASEDKTVRIWDVATGKLLLPPLEHLADVWGAALRSDGKRVVTTSGSRTTQEWNVDIGRPPASSLVDGVVLGVPWSTEGNRIAMVGSDQVPHLWNATTGELRPIRLQHPSLLQRIAFSSDGAKVLTIDKGNEEEGDIVRAWNDRGEPVSPPLSHPERVVSVASSPDGARIFTLSVENVTAQRRDTHIIGDTPDATVTVRVWGTDAGNDTALSLWSYRGDAFYAAFSFDGTAVVITSGESACIRDSLTGALRSDLPQHPANVTSAAFSPDGSRVVTISADGTARVWDAANGKLLSSLLAHRVVISRAAFSPDSARIVTANANGTARVWDAKTGKPLSPPLEHRGEVRSAAFSFDGSMVVTAGDDKTARVWDAILGEALLPPLKHEGAVRSAAFSADGSRIVTVSDDHAARIWSLPLDGRELDEWRKTMERASPYVLSHGALLPKADLDDRAPLGEP